MKSVKAILVFVLMALAVNVIAQDSHERHFIMGFKHSHVSPELNAQIDAFIWSEAKSNREEFFRLRSAYKKEMTETRGVRVDFFNCEGNAYANGLRVGDIVTHVNGRALAGITSPFVQDMILGNVTEQTVEGITTLSVERTLSSGDTNEVETVRIDVPYSGVNVPDENQGNATKLRIVWPSSGTKPSVVWARTDCED